MKKVLVISSSPRKNGNTELLCGEFMRGASESGHEVKEIRLSEKHVGYCTGCSVCSMYGKPCPQKDDAENIIDEMIGSDVIVLATPVYFYSMSAQLKTFIDRCCGKYTLIRNKIFYFIAAGAEGDQETGNLERTFTAMEGFLECLDNAVLKGKIMAKGVWHEGEVKGNPAMESAYLMGKEID